MTLSDDDRHWLNEVFETNRINHKQILESFRTHVDQRLDALVSRVEFVEPRLHSLQIHVDKVQERSDVRFQGLEANLRVSHVRLDDLEERVKRLEHK